MIQTHICPDCQTFLVAADLTDMVLLRAAHHCASRQDRNQTLGFGYPMLTQQAEDEAIATLWRIELTVEDARFLAAMKIDPL